MSMKFSKTKGTEGLLKLTKFGVATLISGYIRPQQYLKKQLEYGNLLRRRHFAAKKRPTGDALASRECICVSSSISCLAVSDDWRVLHCHLRQNVGVSVAA